MDRLSGSQAKQLQSALLSAFGISELKHLVTFELNQQLENIVPSGPMSSVAFELIMWSEQHGKTAELIKAVIAARPNNPAVAALGTLLASAPTATPAVNTADLKRRLRGVLLDQFPRKTDLAILLSDTLGQALDAVAGGENHTEVCFKLVEWLWVDTADRLKPFLAVAVKERPNNAELKALASELAAN